MNKPLSIQLLYQQGVIQFRDQLAVVAGERAYTYGAIGEAVTRLCSQISAQAPEAAFIGVSTTRGWAMVVNVLAILQAGKTYVPLDPQYPTARLQQIIDNAGLAYCLAPSEETALFEGLGLHVVVAEDGPAANPQAEAIGNEHSGKQEAAYVLYTSGSTGVPKGVSMGHAALLNLLQWQQANSTAGPGTRTLQFAPLSFDVSFQEIFATLTTGGILVLANEAQRRDLAALLNFIDSARINRLFLPFVALQHLAEMAVSRRQFPATLTEVMTAGEQLKITPQLADFFTALPACTLYNQYGPTECHVVTQLVLHGDPAGWERLPAIGQAIANTVAHVLTPDLQPVPAGEIGELCISGVCLADGYLNQPELTAEKFIIWSPPTGPVIRLYRTGDLARLRPTGDLEFLGRRDEQVKVRGHRIELGEVEALLATLPGVGQVAVAVREIAEGHPDLVAYVVPMGEANVEPATLRLAAAQVLPAYMLPAAFVVLAEFPKTSSGKINRQALPALATQRRAALGLPYRAARTATERSLAAVWARMLRLEEVGVDDNFFELGGTSLLAQTAVALLQAESDIKLPVTQLYQHPTVAGAAAYLNEQRNQVAAEDEPTAPEPARALAHEVAIIGMAGRFPGAQTIEELWDVLREGRETTRFFTPAELDATIAPALRNDPRYVAARGVIAHADEFDASFFKLNPKLAAAMDPQQRVFLEIAWEALEQGGCLPAHYAGRVGVFAGAGNNSYYPHNVQGNAAVLAQLGDFQVMTVNEKDYMASRVAYTLDLRGPAVSVQSACSTGLLAVAQAVQSLRAGQCEVALAGAASITSPLNSGYLYQEGSMLSADGHCRPFDAQAKGTVFSDGAAVVLLKPLDAALRDGDRLYAVIKGVGISNDGGKGSFSAPSATGQAAAISAALADGAVAPASISYVEAHGTATPIGDPIEVEGLHLAFGPGAPASCALGSIKSNMGHLTAAAGVAGLIKTVLALQHQQLPASLHYTQPNPLLDLANGPFFVNAQLREWPAGGAAPRRAGVSSFGVGGTNVHVVLEEAPEAQVAPEPENRTVAATRPAQLITWSARTASSCSAYAQHLSSRLAAAPNSTLAKVAFTLQTTRQPMSERRFVVAASAEEAAAALQLASSASAPGSAGTVTELPGAVAFLFPGQGAQYLGMGSGLYATEPVFRAAVDECASLLQQFLDVDIRQVIHPAENADAAAAASRLQNTRYTQPALFVVEYALAKLWLSWGISPTALCGHSIGEWVAACLAGVFTLADALQLVARRGQLVSELPGGSMLAIRATEARVLALLPAGLSVAAVNGRQAVVVAGEAPLVTAFAELLTTEAIPSRLLAAQHAFHSTMMAPAVAAFEREVALVTLAVPQLPIVSTVTGTWLTDAQATDPSYWAQQLQAPVQFAAALDTILAEPNPLLLEVGPGNTTATLARQQAAGRPHAALAGLPAPANGLTDSHALLTTLGQLWLRGLEPDWRAFYAGQSLEKLDLPTYCFDRQRCWLDPVGPAPRTAPAVVPAIPTPAVLPPAAILPEIPMRRPVLLQKITAVLAEAADIEILPAQANHSFLELGLDSLLLTQVALNLRKTFEVPITFRQLSETLATPAALAAYLDEQLPPEPHRAAPPIIAPSSSAQPEPAGLLPAAAPDSALGLIAAQLQLLARQVALLQGSDGAGPTREILTPSIAPANSAKAPAGPELTPAEAAEHAKPFGATARIERQSSAPMPAAQQRFLTDFTKRYNQKTGASKAYAQQHRPHMADPRVVSGFTPQLKEITYPLVVSRSAGSRLWDLDGHEYVDVLNGFGSSLFGHQPAFVKTILHEQIESGYEVGPQHALAGEVAQLLCELTGHDRAALCNTGSEAVLGALRVARTVTGRSLVVAFTGSYHGINDEVIVRGSRQLKSRPAAPGILPEAVQNMLILDYGTEESLRIIAERAHELAAVLVEPVQSRRPEFQPVAFLQEVRRITAEAGVALIFDEVITGFRLHQGGAQALFGVRADLATYGKVIGGGLPIGAIAGRRGFMDALDGGTWQYGDASVPEMGVTYFAGTFVRHPLALAAAKASLHHLRAEGPELQTRLNATTHRLATQLNAEAARWQLPLQVVQCGSLWKIKFTTEQPYNTLLFTLMREKGIHIWDHFPCFLTTAHTDADVAQVVAAFAASAAELSAACFFSAAGFFPAAVLPFQPAPAEQPQPNAAALNRPPVPGARLGRDAAGNPAWFLSDPVQPGKFLQVINN